jgi:WD40 repeat protein
LERSNALVTSSKDTFVKVWDLQTQHCVQTVVGHRSEVWSFDVNQAETRMYTGATDQQLRVWKLMYYKHGKPNSNNEDDDHRNNNNNNTQDTTTTTPATSEVLPEADTIPTITFYGFVPRSSNDRVWFCCCINQSSRFPSHHRHASSNRCCILH